jgi:hypothetical protein
MPRNRRYVLFLAMAGLLASCGAATTPKAPTHRSTSPTGTSGTSSAGLEVFTQRANTDCKSFNTLIVSLPRDTTAAAYFYDTPIIVRGDVKLDLEFRALTPPASEAARFSELRALKAQLIELVVLQFNTSRKGNTAALARVDHGYEATATHYNLEANELGLTQCAAQTAPSSTRPPPPLPRS